MQDAMQKQFVIDAVEENRNNIALLGDNIFYFAELGMQEYRTSGMMTEILEQAGFEIERNISGMPTAFIATYGSGTPVVALHTEFDATPSSSQMAGVAEQRPIVDGAPGHTEGHNVNAAVMIGAAVAVKKTMEQFDIQGTLRVYGAPAEEQLVSRPYFVRDGYFKDVDVALHDHIGSNLGTVYGLRQYALISAEFTFKGESAHAATSPWTARDALDAVVLMDIGWDKLREHLEPSQRSHRVITNGGDQPNVIPNTSTIWWFFREATAEKARALFEKAKRVAQGRGHHDRHHLLGERAERGGAHPLQPHPGGGDPEEHRGRGHAAVVRGRAEAHHRRPDQGQRQGHGNAHRGGPAPEAVQSVSANDSGDVCWVVPSGVVNFPSNIPGIAYHHWGAGVSLATSVAHKGAVVGAKTMAASAVDLLMDPQLVARAKETFKEEIGDVEYRPLLPDDQQPPLELNRILMERYRSAMEAHYPKEKPAFS